MFLRFDSALTSLWLVADRRGAARVEPDGIGWTERWMRLDRRRALALLEERRDRAETVRIARDSLARIGESRLSGLDDTAVLRTAASHVAPGWAVLVERVHPSGGWHSDAPAPPASVPEAIEPEENPTGVPIKKDKDHFIIVELVGESGEPIPNELCRLTLPDGTMVERKTNSQGKLEEYGIVEGDCKIEFPELDKDAWEAVI